MRMSYLLMLVACLVFSGCGDIEWFPETDPTFSNNSTNTNPANSPRLTKVYAPKAILAGTTSTLTFTIANATGNPAQSGLAFVDKLDSSLTITKGTSTCGGDFSVINSQIILISGQLAAGTERCTMTATVGGTSAGTFTNRTADVTNVQGGLVNGVTDQPLTIFPASVADSGGTLTAFNLKQESSSDATGRTYNISVDVTNSGATEANVAVEVIAVDANGETARDSGGNEISGLMPLDPVAAGATITLGPISMGPFLTDVAEEIIFWRISTVQQF